MRNAIILHGQPDKKEYYNPKMPSMSNAHWIPWLQSQLLKHDILAATPEVPFAYNPDWNLWKKEVERFEIGSDTLIVGHSRGCDFWLRYLSERDDLIVGKVVLVAPSIGYLQKDKDYFGHYVIDPELTSRTTNLIIFHSDNDHRGVIDSVTEISNKLKGIEEYKFHLGHFTSESMKSTEFPELLKVLID